MSGSPLPRRPSKHNISRSGATFESDNYGGRRVRDRRYNSASNQQSGTIPTTNYFHGEGPMRKYLLIGLALIFASALPTAQALQGCPNMNLLNGNGGFPVPEVVGNVVQAF